MRRLLVVVSGRVDIFTVTSTPDINCGFGADACDRAATLTVGICVNP